MPFAAVKSTTTQPIPVFQKIYETVQGGFQLDETVLPAGTLIKAGTLMGVDEATRKGMPWKGGVLQTAALNTDVTYRFLKGSNLAVGQTINLPGGTPRAITAIDVSNANYDQITVGTTIGVAAAIGIGAFVNDNGNNKPFGLLLNDTEVPVSGQSETFSVVPRGTVYDRRIPPIPASLKALIPSILFSQSF